MGGAGQLDTRTLRCVPVGRLRARPHARPAGRCPGSRRCRDHADRPRGPSVPIELAHLRTFSLDGTERRDLHGWEIAVATPEKVLSDSALSPAASAAFGDLQGFATRAHDSLDWREAVRLIDTHPERTRGDAPAGRTARVLETPVPEPLARRAAHPGQRVRRILLGDHEFDGSDGELLAPWNVVANIDAADLREELRR